jgi:hypothetical protein
MSDAQSEPDDEPAAPEPEPQAGTGGEVIDSPTVNAYVVGVTITEGDAPEGAEG